MALSTGFSRPSPSLTTGHLSWYLPDVQGREPDFILYSEDVGLIIFEVKDWALDQIIEGTHQHFLLRMEGCEEKRQNPLQQARTYFNLIMEKIREDAHLVSKEPYAHGNVKIPVNCGVVFPNINKFEYVQKGLDRIIATEKIFFWDDLHPQSPLCSDTTGRCFRETLRRMFAPRFDFKITGKELDKRGLLHNWISEDYRAKRSYDVTTESVTISTIHSVKGFDYACVFLLTWTGWRREGGRNSRSSGWPMSRSPGRGRSCLFPIVPETNSSEDF